MICLLTTPDLKLKLNPILNLALNPILNLNQIQTLPHLINMELDSDVS